jgi:hypothetical protein
MDTVAHAASSTGATIMPNALRAPGLMEILGFIEILDLFAVRRSVPEKEDRMP